MRFEDWDVCAFVDRYVHRTPANERHCHEFIDASMPCRLYLDLDSKLGHGGPGCSNWTEHIHRIHRLLLSELGLVSSNDESDTTHLVHAMMVWSCHRPDKQSSHVYYPNVWFDSAHNCGAFIRDVRSRFPDIMSTVDEAIYPVLNVLDLGGGGQVKRKPLRMPLSIKCGYPNLCLTLDVGASIGVRGDITALDAVVQSLVTHYPAVHGVLPEHSLHTWKQPISPLGHGGVGGNMTAHLTQEDEDRFVQWLRDWGRVDGGRRITRMANDCGGVSWHIPSTYCPVKGDRHTSNHMFVRIDGDSVWFTCTDSDCRVTFQLGVLGRYILKSQVDLATDGAGGGTYLIDRIQKEYQLLQKYCV